MADTLSFHTGSYVLFLDWEISLLGRCQTAVQVHLPYIRAVVYKRRDNRFRTSDSEDTEEVCRQSSYHYQLCVERWFDCK